MGTEKKQGDGDIVMTSTTINRVNGEFPKKLNRVNGVSKKSLDTRRLATQLVRDRVACNIRPKRILYEQHTAQMDIQVEHWKTKSFG
ncbi:hypothetical protein CHS0354_005170 [Potamilus streckersoni]|uniref:Uncharacterized protein n=1 Tax=Potamilus streckersoni TaxID=2493646 RepID=A0AAE0VJN6_9BIVA|nr:hypothetical protein CHS0354_005170 [Potamilus streckersoni]